jgi:hypothetical protein
MLVLTTLAQMGALHGYAIVLHIQRALARLNCRNSSRAPGSGWIVA